MKLSYRLKQIADLISKYKNGEVLADIGTDHAYLPCYLVENHIITQAYACEVANGPYQSSLATISQHQLQDQVIALLGDGLDPIKDKQSDMIVIAGMGAYLISEILEKNFNCLKQVKVLFLQPNANSDHLRKYLFEHGLMIIDEKMVKDGHHIYEMMVVCHQIADMEYDEYDILFGPVLKQHKDSLFIEKWQHQKHVFENIIKDLDADHPRYIELSHKIKIIEVVLDESL